MKLMTKSLLNLALDAPREKIQIPRFPMVSSSPATKILEIEHLIEKGRPAMNGLYVSVKLRTRPQLEQCLSTQICSGEECIEQPNDGCSEPPCQNYGREELFEAVHM